MAEALIYLIPITFSQIISALYNPIWGILCHIVVLTSIIIRSMLTDPSNPNSHVLIALAMLPLLRITSLVIPFTDIPSIMIHYLSYVIVFMTSIVIVRIAGYSRIQVGINFKHPITQIIMAMTGISFGLVDFIILKPEPLITDFTLGKILIPALILLMSAGFMVEFVFRGVLQNFSLEIFNKWGIVYTSYLFTVTYIGFLPIIELPYMFLVTLLFGYIVSKTESIIGVSLSRGIWNILLYLVIPFLLD